MSKTKSEDLLNSKWRPLMGYVYMLTCLFDFVIAPILWSLLQSIKSGNIGSQWQPLTLQGAGLFHLSMGAILGVAAYGRTQEKLAGTNNNNLLPVTSTTPTTPITTTSVRPMGPTRTTDWPAI